MKRRHKPTDISTERAFNRSLSPYALLAKQILEVMADGKPCTFTVADNPSQGAGMVLATTSLGHRMGVKYHKAKAQSGSHEVAGMLFMCQMRHTVFKTSGLISNDDLASENQRRMFAASLGQRMIEGKDGVALGN
jgi:hypothetical protein